MPDLAFVAFSLGPVQSFISSARTVRDLWSGSFLLSWLAYRAMEQLSDDQLIFPNLRRHPLRLWKSGNLKPEGREKLLEPCLPNRFLAEVDASQAQQIADHCEKACRAAWLDICEKVRKRLFANISDPTLAPDNSLWHRQTESFFEIRTAILPHEACDRMATSRLLGEGLPEAIERDPWIARREIAGKLLQASRSVRHFPIYNAELPQDEKVAQKCSLLGSYEHLGPGEFGKAQKFWEKAAKEWDERGTRVGQRERLSAVSLVKRYAWPFYFSELFGCNPQELRFDDTFTVAAKLWLNATGDSPALDHEKARRDHRHWSGQWLHWTSQHQDEEEEQPADKVWESIRRKTALQGRSPAYYAVLMLDADNMGEHLRKAGLDRNKTISAALAHFALKTASEIVDRHRGELIYAGGDDVLALLPTATALTCARELSDGFQTNWPKLDDTDKATVSAGLVVAHVKEDLRDVLDQTRQAEKAAKNLGRDALVIKVCRRSGEHSEALCPWDQADWLIRLTDAFLKKREPMRRAASDRWAYRLKAELPTLSGIEDIKAIQAEIRRQVNRAEEQTKERLKDDVGVIEDLFGQYANAVEGRELKLCKALEHYAKLRGTAGAPPLEQFKLCKALEDFITLCQTASFLARGRDA